jgi:predicted dehydrogenase
MDTMSVSREAVRFALIGAGNRGQGVFGAYALESPERARFVAVVEPDPTRRDLFGRSHGIPPERRHADIDAFLRAENADVEACIVAALENARLEPVRGAIARRWHVLMEKPLGTTPGDFLELYDAATAARGLAVAVCHPMRLMPGYATLKRLVDSGTYGCVMAIEHTENVAYHHMAHSFVRGSYNNDAMSPMLLAKSCHDLDCLAWLVDAPVARVASFGSLKHFRPENAPPGAPARCLDGCPARDCPYNAEKLYFDPDVKPAYLRVLGIFDGDRSRLGDILRTGPFGRCVFRSDNNVVDSQSAAIQFENGVDVSFLMCGHNGVERRITKISLTNGELHYDQSKPEIHAWRFSPKVRERIAFTVPRGGHGGGDRLIMDNFTEAVRTGDHSLLVTPIARSLEGHLLVFAAEAARASGCVVDVRAFEKECRKE